MSKPIVGKDQQTATTTDGRKLIATDGNERCGCIGCDMKGKCFGTPLCCAEDRIDKRSIVWKYTEEDNPENEIRNLQAELDEFRDIARERLTTILALQKECDALAARLALIERGCAVLAEKIKEGEIYTRNGKWYGTGTWHECITLLQLIEKLGGAE